MQSTVHLFNTALARLGGEQISMGISPQEMGTTGKICANLFPHVLDMALVAHPWAFATRRTALPPPVLTGNDTLGNPSYPFVFELPADCVKTIRLEGYAGVNRTPPFVIEGSTIRCGVARAELVYVARILEPKLWPPLFADALAWGLAAELAAAVNNDAQKQQQCYQAYGIALSNAVVADHAAQNPIRKRSEWTAARFGEGEY